MKIIQPLVQGQQLRAARLNEAIRLAGITFVGTHDATAVSVECDDADENAVRAIIATHLATDWAALEASNISRTALDEAERQAAKADSQIISDLNMTTVDINNTIDNLWSNANGGTAGQRTFLKRLVRIVLIAARRVLRDSVLFQR